MCTQLCAHIIDNDFLTFDNHFLTFDNPFLTFNNVLTTLITDGEHPGARLASTLGQTPCEQDCWPPWRK